MRTLNPSLLHKIQLIAGRNISHKTQLIKEVSSYLIGKMTHQN